MFKGYVKTKGKKPKETLQNRTIFYDVEDLNGKDYGGVLDESIVMIDIDNNIEFDVLYKLVDDLNIKCNILGTTRGGHFYFKNAGEDTNKINAVCPLGLTVDMKLGLKNTVVPLKIDGTERKFLRWFDFDELATLPKWLFPRKLIKKEFYKMGEGGRNQELYNYILQLQDVGFVKEEIKYIIKTVNMILPLPLENRELEIILRKESFRKQSFYNGRTFLFDKFGKWLMKNNNCYKVNDMLCLWDEKMKRYSFNIEKVMCDYITCFVSSKRNEVLKYLNFVCDTADLEKDLNFIRVNNGIVDIETGDLLDVGKDRFIVNTLNVDYRPQAFCKLFDDMLNRISCNDLKIKSSIIDMLGCILFRQNIYGKMFFLLGDGANGKSTLIKVIQQFLGYENYSSLEINDLNEKFRISRITNKLANFGEDISNNYIKQTSILKCLVTGERLTVENKGTWAYEIVNYATMVFSANELPKMGDLSKGLLRRIVIIPFNAEFDRTKEYYNPNILNDFDDNTMSYILNLGIQGLKRIIDNQGILDNTHLENALKEYEINNNPILDFIENTDSNIDNEITNVVFDNFMMFCVQNNIKHDISKKVFSRQLKKLGYEIKVKKVKKKCFKVYAKK